MKIKSKIFVLMFLFTILSFFLISFSSASVSKTFTTSYSDIVSQATILQDKKGYEDDSCYNMLCEIGSDERTSSSGEKSADIRRGYIIFDLSKLKQEYNIKSVSLTVPFGYVYDATRMRIYGVDYSSLDFDSDESLFNSIKGTLLTSDTSIREDSKETYSLGSSALSSVIKSISSGDYFVLGFLGYEGLDDDNYDIDINSKNYPYLTIVYEIDCEKNLDCAFNQICESNICVRDPCDGVVCDSYCSNNKRYTSGYCSSGQCYYPSSTDCIFGCDNLGEFCAEDPCLGVDTSDKCENSIWYHDGYCNSGKVFYNSQDNCVYGCQNEPVGILALVYSGGMCRSSPCEGVTCKDYCSQTTKYTGGQCNNGKCVYSYADDYSEECGYVPFYKRDTFLILVSILVIAISLIILSIFIAKRRK